MKMNKLLDGILRQGPDEYPNRPARRSEIMSVTRTKVGRG